MKSTIAQTQYRRNIQYHLDQVWLALNSDDATLAQRELDALADIRDHTDNWLHMHNPDCDMVSICDWAYEVIRFMTHASGSGNRADIDGWWMEDVAVDGFAKPQFDISS
jgi:hypothetical protein